MAITATQTLYARWRAVEFDITFNANGGNGTMASEHVVYNGSNNVNMACAFTKEGYTFGGWRDEYNNLYVEDTGSSMDDLVYNLYNDGDNVTLYAIWDANEYKVVFHANGATSGTMLDQTLTYDRDQSLTANAFIRQYTVTFNFNGNGTAESSTVVKATFNGWATSANGATVYNDKQSVKNLSTGTTINLYANWTLGTVTLPTPTRTGYTFKGWYTATCGGTKVGDAGATYTPTGAITLHAQWTANGFAVNFDANGGTGSMTEQGFVFDTAQNLIANSFTREGYTFTGWNTKADGTGASYTDKQSVTNIAGTNASITLYAQWTANKYTVTFDINCEGGEGSMNSQSFTYDDEPTELAQNGFTREGYTFIGWSTTKGGSAEYMDKEKVKNLTATNNGTVTLYAVWQINRYSVTFVDAETGETIAVVVVDWGTPSDQVVGQEVNTVLYKLEEGQELPN